jgi:hypothetical protein
MRMVERTGRAGGKLARSRTKEVKSSRDGGTEVSGEEAIASAGFAPSWRDFRCEICKEEYSAFVTERELTNPFVRLCVRCEVTAVEVSKGSKIESYEA